MIISTHILVCYVVFAVYDWRNFTPFKLVNILWVCESKSYYLARLLNLIDPTYIYIYPWY
jgi:hypothetical protein